LHGYGNLRTNFIGVDPLLWLEGIIHYKVLTLEIQNEYIPCQTHIKINIDRFSVYTSNMPSNTHRYKTREYNGCIEWPTVKVIN
jgi:hypothetical protein